MLGPALCAFAEIEKVSSVTPLSDYFAAKLELLEQARNSIIKIDDAEQGATAQSQVR